MCLRARKEKVNTMAAIRHHVMVCTACKHDKAPQGFCQKKGGIDVMNKFIQEVEERELSSEGVQITCTSCLGLCPTEGPCAVIYGSENPGGVWYGQLDEDKVEEICEEHLEEGGSPVEKYRVTM